MKSPDKEGAIIQNYRISKILKIAVLNISIFTALIFAPAITLEVYRTIRSARNQKLDPSMEMSFDDKSMPSKTFRDSQKLTYKYTGFTGWTPNELETETININDYPHNRKGVSEKNTAKKPHKEATWFFGGSTMWGLGVDDSSTIPSFYYNLSKKPTINFGVGGWVSRQSLNKFLTLLATEAAPSTAVFYDGVNEVGYGCNSIHSNKDLPVTARDSQIRGALKPFLEKAANFISSPLQTLKRRQQISGEYDCIINPRKANTIAKHLVTSWSTIHAISKAKGIKSFFVLQPNLATSPNSKKILEPDHQLDKVSKQVESVYKNILKELRLECKAIPELCHVFIDGSNWLNGVDYAFYDWMHVGDKGNKVVAKKLYLEIQKRSVK